MKIYKGVEVELHHSWPRYWIEVSSKLHVHAAFSSVSLQPPWALAFDFQFHNHFTKGRTPWTSDQLVARPQPKHRTTQTQNKHIHIPKIHALCAIRTHDPGFRASEDSTCLRPLSYRDRPVPLYSTGNNPQYLLDWRLGIVCMYV
jgi:hypothetical protein